MNLIEISDDSLNVSSETNGTNANPAVPILVMDSGEGGDGEDVYQTAAQLIHVHSPGSPNVSMRSDVTGLLNADDVPNNLDRIID